MAKIASSSLSWTETPFSCRCQPTYGAPWYSSVSLKRGIGSGGGGKDRRRVAPRRFRARCDLKQRRTWAEKLSFDPNYASAQPYKGEHRQLCELSAFVDASWCCCKSNTMLPERPNIRCGGLPCFHVACAGRAIAVSVLRWTSRNNRRLKR